MTIDKLKQLRESEDKVEFKAAQHNFSFAGGEYSKQAERRKCFLGYVVALCNEEGGMLVLGMGDSEPHNVVGTDFAAGQIGSLEDEVHVRLGIRVHIEELFDNDLRVVVCKIPSRPKGRLMKFEGVPLMRTGESLRNMSDDEMLKILSEQEPDFSAQICPQLSIADLDTDALETMKAKYARKQKNEAFLQLNAEKALTDVKLMADGRLTYAALILVGGKEALTEHLPNAQVNIEYRQAEAQIEFDRRYPVLEPLFKGIDKIWETLNLRNHDNKISEGPYKYDIPCFNEEVIRETVLNAIAHRDYTINSETVIKQFPDKIVVINPGGFPKGVTVENLLKVSSTPRSRLLTEILEKTGLVERSGQGVDKIYRISLSEGKPEPDYSKSDYFQVELMISGEVMDKAFAVFITKEQEKRDEQNKLGTYDVLGLYKIKENKSESVSAEIIAKLKDEGLIIKTGGSASGKYVLSEEYYKIRDQKGEVKGFRVADLDTVYRCFKHSNTAKMGTFVEAFEEELNRDQVRYLIEKMIGTVLVKSGRGTGTKYSLIKEFNSLEELIDHLQP